MLNCMVLFGLDGGRFDCSEEFFTGERFRRCTSGIEQGLYEHIRETSWMSDSGGFSVAERVL